MKVDLVADSEAFLLWEHDWIVGHCLADFDVTLRIDPSLEVRQDCTILTISGGTAGRVERIRQAVDAAHADGRRPMMLHLSDEWGEDDLGIYAGCDVVFRNYYRPDAAKLPNCLTFPLGYRSGFRQGCTHTDFDKRQTAWAFAGEPKGSRVQMLEEVAAWADGVSYLTTCWNDPNSLSPGDYARLLSDTRLAPCPFGSYAPESFRLYEAFEAGAVPVVEDRGGGFSLLFAMRKPLSAAALRSPEAVAKRVRRMFQESYWARVYGADFPALRVRDWSELRPLLAATDLEAVAADASRWWHSQKRRVREEFHQRLSAAFSRNLVAS